MCIAFHKEISNIGRFTLMTSSSDNHALFDHTLVCSHGYAGFGPCISLVCRMSQSTAEQDWWKRPWGRLRTTWYNRLKDRGNWYRHSGSGLRTDRCAGRPRWLCRATRPSSSSHCLNKRSVVHSIHGEAQSRFTPSRKLPQRRRTASHASSLATSREWEREFARWCEPALRWIWSVNVSLYIIPWLCYIC